MQAIGGFSPLRHMMGPARCRARVHADRPFLLAQALGQHGTDPEPQSRSLGAKCDSERARPMWGRAPSEEAMVALVFSSFLSVQQGGSGEGEVCFPGRGGGMEPWGRGGPSLQKPLGLPSTQGVEVGAAGRKARWKEGTSSLCCPRITGEAWAGPGLRSVICEPSQRGGREASLCLV